MTSDKNRSATRRDKLIAMGLSALIIIAGLVIAVSGEWGAGRGTSGITLTGIPARLAGVVATIIGAWLFRVALRQYRDLESVKKHKE